jgi:predicted transposase YdaD
MVSKGKTFYKRLFSESLLYFYRNSFRFCDCQAVVIYPSRSLEQDKLHLHRSLLNGETKQRLSILSLPEPDQSQTKPQ